MEIRLKQNQDQGRRTVVRPRNQATRKYTGKATATIIAAILSAGAILTTGIIAELQQTANQGSLEQNITNAANMTGTIRQTSVQTGKNQSQEVYQNLVEEKSKLLEFENVIERYQELRSKRNITDDEKRELNNIYENIERARADVANYGEGVLKETVSSLYHVEGDIIVSNKKDVNSPTFNNPAIVFKQQDEKKVNLTREFFGNKMPKEWGDLIVDCDELKNSTSYDKNGVIQLKEIEKIVDTYMKAQGIEKEQYELEDGKIKVVDKIKEAEERE